jgi:hypothetical protein
MSTLHLSRSLLASRSRARALESWREAASLVGVRWRAFLEADPASRPWAFASYTAALDAEEAAAAVMAGLPDIVT